MQTTALANRLTAIGHSQNAVLPQVEEQIVLRDTRLRAWKLACAGALSVVAPLRCILNADNELVRIRTLDNDTLEIVYATPSASFSWSANTITHSAVFQTGVDLNQDGDNLQAFFVDGLTIRAVESSDGGHTWGSPQAVVTLGAQSGALTQLTTPMPNVLIYSDSTIGLDEDGNKLTGLYIVNRVSGTRETHVLWDLVGLEQGKNPPVTLPNTQTFPSNLSSLVLDDGRIEVSYYGPKFRQSFNDDVYVQRIGNYDATASSQNLQWTHPQSVFPTTPIGEEGITEIFAAFPRLQRVGSQFWIVALESSKFAGHERYHLGFFRSSDGIHWTDRDYHQGAANDDQFGAYCYDEDAPFIFQHLLYANLVVTSTYTFIVGYDKTFYCPSTVLVGVDNPLRQLDLTPYITDYTTNEPAAPTTGDVSYNLGNVPKEWQASDLLAAHYGIEITHKAGWVTEMGDELLQTGLYHVQSISEHTDLGDSSGQVQALDSTMLMERLKFDIYRELFGPQQLVYTQFCDLIPFNIVAGSMTTGGGGRLKSGIVLPRDNFRDNIAVLNSESADGFITHTRFRCDRTWVQNHAGWAFQGRQQGDGDDNKRFYAILYGRTPNRFTLNEAIPRPNVNRIKLYKYKSFIEESDEVILNDGQWYWLRVANWHGHVMVWYTDEFVSGIPNAEWILVMDFMSPASPPASVLPCRAGWNAMIGTQKVLSANPGNHITKGGQQDLMDGSGNPLMVALLVELEDQPSILRNVHVSLTQENINDTDMPDAIALVLAGDATSPFDATDDDNVIFESNTTALRFSNHTNPKFTAANAVPNPAAPKFSASQTVWVAATFDGVLTTGQSYKWASGGTGTCKISSDGGATWSDAPGIFSAGIGVDYLNGRVKFHKLYMGTGETPLTYEETAHQLASKSGVLDIVPDDFVAGSELVLGADNIYWQPEEYGKIGELVLDADVTISDSLRVYIGSQTIATGDADTHIIELIPDDQTISFSTYSNVLVSISESLQYIPTSFHLQVMNRNNFIYVYINECLASLWYDTNFSVPGYVGIDSVGATFDNLRVPDLTQMVDYWVLEQGESALSSLEKLVAKPAQGSVARAKFFMNWEDKLRISSFSRREVVDTYEDTLFKADKTETIQYVLSHMRPTGGIRYADRFRPRILDTDGHIYDQQDVTDAPLDVDAYAAAADFFRDAEEKTENPTIDHLPVYAAEREDLHLLRNPLDSTNGLYIVNNIQRTVNPADSSGQATQTISYRKYVQEDE